MWNNDLLKKKSTFQPIGLKIQRGHYILGDRYIKSLLVTELPPTIRTRSPELLRFESGDQGLHAYGAVGSGLCRYAEEGIQ